MYKIQNFSFQYLNQSILLQDISLNINQGDFVLLIGKSGSGKSTLLKHLCPSLIPQGKCTGKIYLNNVSVKKSNCIVGFVNQNPDTQIVMDYVWHEIAFGLENLNMPLTQMKQRVGEIVNYFNLQDIYLSKCANLSGGQKQLINLASIVAMNPEIIILDEPTSQLDPKHSKIFMQLIKQLHQDFGTTIIITEHQYEEVLNYSNKVIILDEGKIIKQGSADVIVDFLIKNKHELQQTLPEYVQLTHKIDYQQAHRYIQQHKFEYKSNVYNLNHPDILIIDDLNYLDIIKHCHLKIKKSAITSIVGANGSGKTTLLKCMMFFLQFKGKIFYDNKRLKKRPLQFAFLPQDPQVLFSHDSVLEELQLFPVKEVCLLLEKYNLMGKKHIHPYDLSGGQQQLLGLIKLLLLKPEVIFLDEPTKGLDTINKAKLGEYLVDLAKQGLTIVMVSHDLEFCARYSNMCGMMFNGKVESLSYAHDFFKNNMFYTTQLCKLFKKTNQEVVLIEDVYEI